MAKSLPFRNCTFCGRDFRPKRAWQQFCGPSCRRSAKQEQLKVEYACEYCGMVGETVDHIPPVSIRPTLVLLGLSGRYPFILVRACRECNGALSDKAYWRVDQRREYIARWIERRYHKYLTIPEWTQAELKALDFKLRELTMHGLAVKELTLKRLERARITDTDLLIPTTPKRLIASSAPYIDTTCKTCGKPTQNDKYCSIACDPLKQPSPLARPAPYVRTPLHRKIEKEERALERLRKKLT